MMTTISITTIEAIGALLFTLAVIHTFSTRYFEHLAHTRTAHAGLWHLLGEVEAVFGFWAFVLLGFMAFHVTTAVIQLLLIVAVGLVILHFLRSRRAA